MAFSCRRQTTIAIKPNDPRAVKAHGPTVKTARALKVGALSRPLALPVAS